MSGQAGAQTFVIPESAFDRGSEFLGDNSEASSMYQAKGCPQAWIEKRLRSIAVRGELTDEWKTRGVQEGKEYPFSPPKSLAPLSA